MSHALAKHLLSLVSPSSLSFCLPLLRFLYLVCFSRWLERSQRLNWLRIQAKDMKREYIKIEAALSKEGVWKRVSVGFQLFSMYFSHHFVFSFFVLELNFDPFFEKKFFFLESASRLLKLQLNFWILFSSFVRQSLGKMYFRSLPKTS